MNKNHGFTSRYLIGRYRYKSFLGRFLSSSENFQKAGEKTYVGLFKVFLFFVKEIEQKNNE